MLVDTRTRRTRARLAERSLASAVLALAIVGLAGCGDDGTTVQAQDVGTTAPASSETTAAPREPVLTLDEGRVVINSLPTGYEFGSEMNTNGMFDEKIYSARFTGPGTDSFYVAVSRGQGVLDQFNGPDVTLSARKSASNRELFESHTELMNTNYLGWRVDDSAIVWLTSTALDHDALAAAADGIEVSS